MSLFPTSFLVIQNAHDKAVFARHDNGGDLATICINGSITVKGLVDIEQDAQQFGFGSMEVKEVRIIHVLGSDLAPNVFGRDFDVGQPVSINGDERWQLQTCTQSPDNAADGTGDENDPNAGISSGNMIDITVINAGDGE